MRAEVLGRAMRTLGGCLIGALVIPVLDVASALIGMGVLVGVIALCPRPAARAWLAVTLALATLGTVGLVTALFGASSPGSGGWRVVAPILVVAVGGTYAQAMADWFGGSWPEAARRYRRAVRTSALAAALGGLALVGYAAGPAAPRHADLVLFGHRYAHGPGWLVLAVAVTVAWVAAVIQLMVANGPAARTLRRRDGLAPGFEPPATDPTPPIPTPTPTPTPTATS